MIKAVIFDMDGLLIDSEPLWEEAEIEILRRFGVPLTPEMTKQTMGLASPDVVRYWHDRHPWASPSLADVDELLVERVVELVRHKGEGRPGVHNVINLIEAERLPMAIASSSQDVIIDAVLEKLGIRQHMAVVHSAEHEPFGKPHPGVYITTAEKLGVEPVTCLAFEDSPNGVLAAKAARMKCVAVPDPKMAGDRPFAIADAEIETLAHFDTGLLNDLSAATERKHFPLPHSP